MGFKVQLHHKHTNQLKLKHKTLVQALADVKNGVRREKEFSALSICSMIPQHLEELLCLFNGDRKSFR